MKLNKKIIFRIAATAACLSLVSVPVFADDSAVKSATGYGTLTGVLSASYYGSYFHTLVSYNNDNAYLTINGTVQNQSGSTVGTKAQVNSTRGVTTFFDNLAPMPSNAYAVYGTHGVQGGNTYGASAVYTYTNITN
ncbi:hypothetical protein QW71_35190 [Paenibacillus sp. IHB B 3415]|uniref:hypothetical protein n=1 Tax=Paenibacillus sp. IHB B 3415 TaxID=867080 RepID=UPI000574E0DB|nr:hypothetical protein [Paenibacillus sp. IHB B 3415]KHL91343.1 hypothetical protein QW71_35190 [Paenibacillus sp. IHB B 3415]